MLMTRGGPLSFSSDGEDFTRFVLDFLRGGRDREETRIVITTSRQLVITRAY